MDTLRPLTDREKKMIAPDLQALQEALDNLERAQQRVEAIRGRLSRMAALMHDGEEEDLVLDLDRMVLGREEDAGQEPEQVLP